MRIMSYNIKKNGGGRLSKLANVIRFHEPDIVVMQEMMDANAVRTLAESAGYAYYDAKPGCSPAFISRLSLTYRWHTAGLTRSPFLQLTLDNGLHIYGVHLFSSLSNIAEALRVREIQTLLRLINHDAPHVIVGDFNTLAPGDTFNGSTFPWWLKLILSLNGGDVRRDALRLLYERGYMDAFRTFHPDANGYTLPPPNPNTRLDYAFVSPALHHSMRQCDVLRDPQDVLTASDHYPIMLELAIAEG